MDLSPFQLADTLLGNLAPLGDLRRTREEFNVDDLDRLEAKLVSALRSIGVLRNAFAPINILPREILAHIFGMLAFDDTVPSSFLPDLSIRDDPHLWTQVGHVCRHWRETVLAFPFLWSTIDSDSALAALTFLDRSAASTLRVYLRDAAYGSRYSPSLERARFMQSIAHHSQRFAEMHIQPKFRYGSNIIRSLQHPSPKLKALSIVLNIGKDESQALPTLFDGVTPNLEQLTLANFTTWPGNHFGPNLTHLCLLAQHARGRMPTDDFLDFLQSAPKLQELVLVDAGPASSHAGASDPHRIIALDNLRTLQLGNWTAPETVGAFLSHIALPKSTRVHIWAERCSHTIDTLTMAVPADLVRLQPFHGLKTIHCTARPTTRGYPQLLSVVDGALVFYSTFSATTAPAALASLFDRLDTRALEELTVGIECAPELAWQPILAEMPRLRTLTVLRRPSRPLLAALCRGDTLDEALCPLLERVSIIDDTVLSTVRLFLFALDRAECGLPLRELNLYARTCSSRLESELHELGQYIERVEQLKDNPVDVERLAAGWPTEAYEWAMRQMATRRP
ncbi:F-box protein [Phanerochaete sordida]|uniref:F-box protein n=1 Tax=Phanerochaete sordida TaxID=48140 RepID=A0A9P3GG66_9APHY|nr:F-box protein [Phanerochaete sordida]